MNRKKSAGTFEGIFVAGAMVALGWLFLHNSAAHGISYTVRPTPLNYWVFEVGKGSQVSFGMEQRVDSNGNSTNQNVLTHLKSVYLGPYVLVLQTKEYPLIK